MEKEKLVVSKFGGTSMGDAQCMLRSAEVALRHKSRIIVVSATSGTTNSLIRFAQEAQSDGEQNLEELISELKNKHLKIAHDLKMNSIEELNLLISELISLLKGIQLLRECSPKALDAIQSLGERMSSILFVQAIKNKIAESELLMTVELLDVRSVLKTDAFYGRAVPLVEEIRLNCHKRLVGLRQDNIIYVTQGFIGSTLEGVTTTLGRGGSDYSAALLAEGVGADLLEIWTDVAGIATTDPRLCSEAKVIPELTFREASELATFGAKVLHPSTLMPAIRQNIPVFVGSSFESESGGTWIRKECDIQPTIRAMALRTKQVLVTLTTPEMLNAHGFLMKIARLFNDHKVSVDAITTSEISVALTVDFTTLENKDLFKSLREIADVLVEENMTLVSLIGNGIHQTAGLGKVIFDAIPDINVRMICLGASRHNFCFLVEERWGPECIRRLHRIFIEN